MAEVAPILVALVLSFIAFKVLMGLVRVGVILLIFGGLYVMWQQGTFA